MSTPRPNTPPVPDEEERVQGGEEGQEISDADLRRLFGVPNQEEEDEGGEAPAVVSLQKQRTWH